MVEPITLFTAIAGVTNLASRLTIDLTRLSVTLKHVPEQMKQVCSEMVGLNATLTTLQQRFNPLASGYSEEQLSCLETVVGSIRETLSGLGRVCGIDLEEGTTATDTEGSRGGSAANSVGFVSVTGKGKKKQKVATIWAKFSWTLNESEITSYRSGLVSYTTMLNLLTATLADQRGANIEAMVTKTNEMLETLMERRKRMSIISNCPDSVEAINASRGTLKRGRGKVGQAPSIKSKAASIAAVSEAPPRRSSSRPRGSGAQGQRSQSAAPTNRRPQGSMPVRIDDGYPPSNSGRRSSSRSRHAPSAFRSASATHLPLDTSGEMPPLPRRPSQLHINTRDIRDIPPILVPGTPRAASYTGLPSPPPVYTEIAPGLLEDAAAAALSSPASSRGMPRAPPSSTGVPSTTYSRSTTSSRASSSRASSSTRAQSSVAVSSVHALGQRQMIRQPATNPPTQKTQYPAPPPSRPSSAGGARRSERPSYQRALSSASAAAVEAAMPGVKHQTPPLPKMKTDGHKLEFAGQWRIREIRVDNSFMGSGRLWLKKDEEKKRVLFNLRLDRSKESRLSYRWVSSTTSLRTKPASIFSGPSYLFQNLVRADDYSGSPSGRHTIRLEEVDYMAGQRSLLISVNLIEQSPWEWLLETKPPPPPPQSQTQTRAITNSNGDHYTHGLRIDAGYHAPNPQNAQAAGGFRNFFRSSGGQAPITAAPSMPPTPITPSISTPAMSRSTSAQGSMWSYRNDSMYSLHSETHQDQQRRMQRGWDNTYGTGYVGFGQAYSPSSAGPSYIGGDGRFTGPPSPPLTLTPPESPVVRGRSGSVGTASVPAVSGQERRRWFNFGR